MFLNVHKQHLINVRLYRPYEREKNFCLLLRGMKENKFLRFFITSYFLDTQTTVKIRDVATNDC